MVFILSNFMLCKQPAAITFSVRREIKSHFFNRISFKEEPAKYIAAQKSNQQLEVIDIRIPFCIEKEFAFSLSVCVTAPSDIGRIVF